ncbi:MAG: hypothetical protein GWP41_01950 [Planctomycetia bacterium]|nr:hypothetical protein [Planctomycetia bacterium]
MNEVVMKHRNRWGLNWILVVTFVAVLGFVPSFTETVEAQVRPDVRILLDEGINLFQQGKLGEARQSFERALLLDITSEEALNWVDKVGYGELIRVIRTGDDTLSGQMGTLLRLTSLETKRRSMDESAINDVLDTYFGDEDLLERTKLLYRAISDHGVYLLPGLVERLGQPEQKLRVLAIQAITRISDDAVLPLCRCLHASEQGVVMGAVGALQKIGHPAAVPSLRWLAQSTGDPLVKAAANNAADGILPGSSSREAYGLLTDQAHAFSTDGGMLVRTYHDPVVWQVDGGSLNWTAAEGWELNELRAEQFLLDALSLKPGGDAALALHACNQMARWSEYRDVTAVISNQVDAGDADESQISNLRGRELEMEKVRASAFAMSPAVVDAAVEVALTDRRPQAAIELIDTLSYFNKDSGSSDVPASVVRALAYDHRGVRFSAASCVAHMGGGTGFQNSDKVVPNLTEGLAEASRKVALTIFPNQDDALRVGALLARANIEPFNDEDPLRGLERAVSFPKHLIAISSDTGAMPAAELISRLRKDYRTSRTPILVFASDDNFTQALQVYGDEETGVFVVNRSIDALRLRNDLLVGLLADSDASVGQSVAEKAAVALEVMASPGRAFDLNGCVSGAIRALDDPSDAVRIPCCQLLAKLAPLGASDALVRIVAEGDAASVDLRYAALLALGNIHRGAGTSQVAPSVMEVINSAMDTGEVALIQAASRASGLIGN